MIASNIQNSAAAAADFLSFGIIEVMVAIKIKDSKIGRCRGRFLNFGIKEVLVVRNLDFEDWPFQENAAAKLNKFQNMILRTGHYYNRLCQLYKCQI